MLRLRTARLRSAARGAALGRWLAVLVAVLAATVPASAQRVQDVFPGPITGADVDELARLVGLSEIQRIAIDPAHAKYLDDYRALRTKEMEPFLRGVMGTWRSFIVNPNPDAVKDIIRDIERSEQKLAIVDDQFFASIDAVLTPSQREAMVRVRSRRQLDRTSSGVLRGMGQALPAITIDLGRIVERADLDPATMDTLEPLIQDFESRTVAARRRLRDAMEKGAIEVVTVAADLLRRALSGEISPEEGGDLWQRMRGILYEKGKPIMGDMVDLVESNGRTIESWRPLLPPEIGDRLALYFLHEGHGDLMSDYIRVRDRHDAALRLPDLPANLATTIRQQRDLLTERSMRQARKALRVGYQVISDASFILEDDGRTELVEKAEAEVEALEAIADQAGEQLAALLGEDLMNRLGRDEADGGPLPAPPDPLRSMIRPEPRRLLGRQPDVPGLDVEPPDFEAGGPLVAGPIAERELDWYASMLGLDELDRELLATLHMDYRSRFEAIKSTTIAELEALHERASESRGREQEDADAARIGADAAAALAAIPAARLAAENAIAGLDEDFFQEIRLTLLDAESSAGGAGLDDVRSARERVRLGVANQGGLSGWARRMSRMGRAQAASGEAGVDLMLLLHETALDRRDADLAASTLATYATERRDALATLRQASIDRAETLLSLNVDRLNGTENGRSMWQQASRAGDAVTDARRRIGRVNRRALDRLDDALPPGAAIEIRERYDRTAFPNIFEDEQGAERPLLAALALDTLDPDQASRINELLALYRPRYRELNQGLIEQETRPATGQGPARWQAMMARSDRVDQIRFDRDELNGRALRALRSILDEDQAMEVGFLPRRD